MPGHDHGDVRGTIVLDDCIFRDRDCLLARAGRHGYSREHTAGQQALAVVDQNGDLVGTITQTDLFRVIISLTGVGSRGIQFAFQLEDRPGSIKEVCDVIRKFQGRIVSILTSYEGVADGYRKVYIRIHSIERSKLQQLKEELSRMAALIYMVDHRENTRTIYAE